MSEYQATLNKLHRIEYQLRIIEEDHQLDNRPTAQTVMEQIFKSIEHINNAVDILEVAIENPLDFE